MNNRVQREFYEQHFFIQYFFCLANIIGHHITDIQFKKTADVCKKSI